MSNSTQTSTLSMDQALTLVSHSMEPEDNLLSLERGENILQLLNNWYVNYYGTPLIDPATQRNKNWKAFLNVIPPPINFSYNQFDAHYIVYGTRLLSAFANHRLRSLIQQKYMPSKQEFYALCPSVHHVYNLVPLQR